MKEIDVATERQIAANKNNSKRSTGPKTAKGKSIVAMNAIKHGLLSREVLLHNEDEAALVELGKNLRAQLQPIGEMEVFLVDRIITCAWRLRRVLSAEVSVLKEQCTDIFGEEKSIGLAFIRDGNGSDTISRLSRYESAIERSLYKALDRLLQLQEIRRGSETPVTEIISVEFKD